ncbi:MAG: beta-N-acetylhexosaminidase [Eubacteriales bacterium]|nr:beta-N-acetylhexosaminidase [Eubacteriales bacterium]
MNITFPEKFSDLQKLADKAVCVPGDGGLKVVWQDGQAQIEYSQKSEYFRALGWIRQWIREGKKQESRKEERSFQHLTYMVDCSRNAVPSVSFLKDLMVSMALMGYDRLMLYTEDTYEIEGRPFFGWMRGRYTRQELGELEEWGEALGIELVPCIQTLAHLNAIFRWKAFAGIHDTGDILSTGEEDTYALIEDMVRTWAETVKSRVINIGMDEAEMIGRGSYLNRYGYEDRLTIMRRHLQRVLSICEKYGFTCMMWSDMFFKMFSGEGYYSKNLQITPEQKNQIPQNVELIYWDYYSRDEATYVRMIENHKKLSDRIGFAGGAWKWNGYAPLLNHSVLASRIALPVCKRFGIGNVIVTGWGDDGGEAAQASILPVLCLYAESCYADRTDDSWLEERMHACTGESYTDFLRLDLPNLTPDNPCPGRVAVSPEKYLLYQDSLLGIYDRHVDPETYPAHFKAAARELAEAAERSENYSYLFKTLHALCRVLKLKCDLGLRIRDAYQRQDRAELSRLADRASKTAARLEEFRRKCRKQWFLENKAFGWEVLDLRLGGAKTRLESAAERLQDYANGKIDRIEELEEPRLLLDERENPGYRTLPLGDNTWKNMVSASVI